MILRKKIQLSIITFIGLIFLISLLLVLPLRWLNPITTAFVLRDDLVTSKQINKHWSTIDNIAPSLAMSVIASEDQKFPYHYGFDIEALKKALTENRARRRGGSTITQQLAKNIYLSSSRSLLRKGTEAYLAVLIESFLPKKRIMEIYLNVVEFGPGIYGVTQASQAFFNKVPEKLTQWESALLASVLPNPKQLSAQAPSNYVRQRARDIQQQVRALGGVGYFP